jgi:hypothetical protein
MAATRVQEEGNGGGITLTMPPAAWRDGISLTAAGTAGSILPIAV